MLRVRNFLLAAACMVLMAFSSTLMAAPKDAKTAASTTTATESAIQPDPEIGQQINGVCAGCHGPMGEGGKKGEYPRLAGQDVEYLKAQLLKFKGRKRTNMPMFPYTEERELPDDEIVHIAAYLAAIKLDTAPPAFTENDDALARLTAMAKVFNVPRAEGDVDAGAKVYKRQCAPCHGANGLGKKGTPMLAGQYTQYLSRQINKFIAGERIHDVELKDWKEDVLNDLKPEQIRDILAYLSVLNN